MWTDLQSPHVTGTEAEDKVREMISEKLKMDHRKIEVEHAHTHRDWACPLAQVTGPGQ